MNLTKEEYDIGNVDFISWKELKDKTIFITGATGLIGAAMINSLINVSRKLNLKLRIIALVRNIDRAKERFQQELDYEELKFVIGNVEKLPKIQENIDYIVHGASQTASRAFVEHAVETIDTAIIGTRNVLELAKNKNVRGLIYLSSMEVYGYPKRGHKVSEEEIGSLSPIDVRNSYPISKLMCEAMCCAYYSEYKVPVKVVRLTQTYGSNVNFSDNRIFAYLVKCVIEKQDIILKTKGETERSYLYVLDAVTAILTVLQKGESGEAYNAADEDTYSSIADIARKIALDANIKVKFDIQEESVNGFPQTLYMDLDTNKLKMLGWKPLKKEKK